MKSRKGGEYIGESLGFWIAIFGILILGFLVFKLYGFFVDQELRNAKSFMNGLEKKIGNLKDGEEGNFVLRGVKGWVLVGWNKSVSIADDTEVISSDKKPQKCFDKNCLCLCEKEIKNCQDGGYCRFFDREIEVLGKIEYWGGNSEGAYKEKRVLSCVIQNDLLMDFSVNKGSQGILVSYDYGYHISGEFSDEKNEILEMLYEGDFIGVGNDMCYVSHEILDRR